MDISYKLSVHVCTNFLSITSPSNNTSMLSELTVDIKVIAPKYLVANLEHLRNPPHKFITMRPETPFT